MLRNLLYLCGCAFLVCASIAVLQWSFRPTAGRYVGMTELGAPMLDTATGQAYFMGMKERDPVEVGVFWRIVESDD